MTIIYFLTSGAVSYTHLDVYKRQVEASPDRPVLIEKFLEDAIEIDVDAVSDGEQVVLGGIMEHIEEAGVHSGDSACIIPVSYTHLIPVVLPYICANMAK